MLFTIFLRNIILFLTVLLCSSTQAKSMSQEASLNCHLATAKKIILDSLPGEEVLAEKILINCIRLHPNDLEVILTLAQFIEQQVILGEKPPLEMHKSLSLVSQAYALAPYNPKVRYMLAHVLGTVGKYEEAQNLYDTTFQEFPYEKETLIEKAKLIVEKKPEEAFRLITESIKMGTSIDDVIVIILNCVRLKNQPDSYLEDLALVTKQFENRWLFHKLGLAYIEEKKYDLAAKAFSRAIQLGNSVESKLQLAIIQYQYLEEHKNSILNFKSLIQEAEKNKYMTQSSQALLYSHYSLALFTNHKIQEASRAAVQVALKSFSKREFIESLVYEYKSRHALPILQSALEIMIVNDPAFDLPHASLGEIYETKKDYLAALQAFDKAIIINPQKMLYVYHKSCVLARLGKKQESLQSLKIALNADNSLLKLAQSNPDFSVLKSDARFSEEFASLFSKKYDNTWVSTETDFKFVP